MAVNKKTRKKNVVKVRKFAVDDVVAPVKPVEKETYGSREVIFTPDHHFIVFKVDRAGVHAVRKEYYKVTADHEDYVYRQRSSCVFEEKEINLIGKLQRSETKPQVWSGSEVKQECLTEQDRPHIVREAKNKAKSEIALGSLFSLLGLGGTSLWILAAADVIPKDVFMEVIEVFGATIILVTLVFGSLALLGYGLYTLAKED